MSTHEHVCGACGRPDTPRVWRAGDPEPGEDVRAVLDAVGDVWWRVGGGLWSFNGRDYRWPVVLLVGGALVEVTLPEAVTS